MTLVVAIILAQASAPFGGMDVLDVIKLCTVNSQADGTVPPAPLRAEAEARGWGKADADMLIKVCKSYTDGAEAGRAEIRAREKAATFSSR